MLKFADNAQTDLSGLTFLEFLTELINDLWQLAIKSFLLNILSHYWVQRIPQLMRDTGVDDRRELHFGFELSIQNMVCHVHDLDHC